MPIKIATIITCFNRKDKTIRCLNCLFASIDKYNEKKRDSQIQLAIYLTDDGCTDGTADAVREVCKHHELHIIKGNGQCFWAGGMRMAWRQAMHDRHDWDFYLLLNDDTFMYPDCMMTLIHTHDHCVRTYGKPGIYSGITCDTANTNIITYGGYVWTNYFLGLDRILQPSGEPQQCDKANSNIMLVSRRVVETMGIFYEGFVHGAADYDYSMQARKKGFPVLVTGKTCGCCDYDHNSHTQIKEKLLTMNLHQRKEYFNHPLHSNHDVMLHKRRNTPQRYVLGYIGRMLNLYFPKLYYFISNIRKR